MKELHGLLVQDIKNYSEVFDNIQQQLQMHIKKVQRKIAVL